MSNFPHDQDGAGDIKSMRRAAWAAQAANSKYLAIIGGSAYPQVIGAWDGLYGNLKYNWDQPEGWMQRLTYHGTSAQPPFDALAGGQNGSINWQSQTGLTNLERTNSSGDNASGTTGTVIKLANSDGAGDEVYTNKFNNVGLESILAKTPSDGQWYLSFYAKRGYRTCTATVFIFGCAYNASHPTDPSLNNTYSYNTGITDVGVDASSSTIASPATGGTSYYTTAALTTSWVKHDMCFKFDGTAVLQAITCRIDNNNGNWAGDTEVFIDRLTLHPMNVAMSDVLPGQGTNANLGTTGIYGTYS